MATVSWASPEAIQTALSTDLNSLGNGSFSAASSAIANSSGLYLYINLELYLNTLTPTAGGYVAVYLIPTIDGTNYIDTTPPANTLIATFDLNTANATKRRSAVSIPIPPFDFKLMVENKSGAAFNASSNTLKYRRYSEQVA